MEVKATAKYLRISPRKARLVIDLIRGKSAREAEAILRFTPNKGAEFVAKVLHSAIANAENNRDLKKADLKVKRAAADPGPMLKRFRPKARGMAGRIRKRMSHFTVILTDE